MEGWAWPNDTKFTAYGQSVLNYWGTNADASVSLSVTKNGTVVTSNQGDAEDSNLLPGSRGLTANTNSQVFAGCGHAAQATAHGHVYNSAFINSSWTTWGSKRDTDTRSSNQDACPSGTPGNGDPGPPPSGDPGSNCHWVRDFVIYTDLSWEYLNSWHRECDGDEMSVGRPVPLNPGAANRLTASSAASAATPAYMFASSERVT